MAVSSRTLPSQTLNIMEQFITINMYYSIDEETNQKVYDVEYIREEFESKLAEILNK